MHARNRTWPLGSDPAERCRDRTGLIDSPDGSTLSLDFTTGVLDPRLTFTRTSNATFINSIGLVEWANANMYWNTAFDGLSGTNPTLGAGTGWGYALTTGGSAVFNGDGTVTITTTAAERRAIFRSSGFSGNGLRVIASVEVTIHSGSLQASQVMVTGTPTNAQHYVNGTAWNSSHPSWNGGILPVGTQFTFSYATDCVTGGTTSMYFGVGCSSAIAGSATFSNPRWTMWKGSGTVPYYPNTSATNNSTANYFKSNDYQAPRFDYDPTTIGTPRGLLIEGSATNLCTWSQDFSNANWALDNGTATNPSVSVVSQTAPDGASSVNRITFNKTGGTFSRIRQTLSGTAAATYTLSVWMKANTASGGAATQNVGLRIGADAAGFNCVVTTTWKRFSYSYALSGTDASAQIMLWDNIVGNDETADVLVWGAQLEAGSGASSYIPTGASTGTRNADVCNMTGTNFSSWFTLGPGTVLIQQDFTKNNTRNLAATISNGGTTYIEMGYRAVGFSTEAIGYNNAGSLTFTSTAFTPTINTPYKSAYVWEPGATQLNVCANGTLGTAASSPVTGAMDRLILGADGTSPTAAYILSGHIKSLKYWPTRLPNAQLQSLTT